MSVLSPSLYTPGENYTTAVTIDSPTGFAAASYKVPGYQNVRLLSFYVLFTTTATLGTRIPYLYLADAQGNEIMQMNMPAGQGPGQQIAYTWAYTLSSTSGAINSAQTAPWPDVLVPSTWSINLDRSHIDASDTLGSIMLNATFVRTGAPLQLAPAVLTPTPLIA